MSELLPTLVAAAPLAAGWSVHALWWRRRIEEARRDPLTGLPVRAVFLRRANRLLKVPGAVMVLVDLDRFKALNDTHGHAAGDAVLARLAERLMVWAGALDGCAGRLGGDEFTAVVVPRHPDGISCHLDNLFDLLCAPVPFRDVELRVGASIGAYVAERPPELGRAMRRADEAMYTAKRAGGGWRIADTPTPAMTSTNGRRTGRPGTSRMPGWSQ